MRNCIFWCRAHDRNQREYLQGVHKILKLLLDEPITCGYSGDIMVDLTAYIDGGTRGKPRSSGIGVVVEHAGGRRVEISQWIGAGDNNYAEYAALLVALEYAVAFRCRRLQVFSDSEVVVKQMTGEYSCQSSALKDIHLRCKEMIAGLDEFAIAHIRREFNNDANRLVSAAMQRGGSVDNEEFLVLLGLTPPQELAPGQELQPAFAEAMEN